MKLRLFNKPNTAELDPEAADNALMQEYQAAIALAAAAREDKDAADIEFHDIEKTARGRVMAAARRQGETYIAAQLANAEKARVGQKVRSSNAVDPLVREDGPVLPMLCKAIGHIQQHVPLKLGEDRAALRDLHTLGIQPGGMRPSGVPVPGSVQVALLERAVPLADWAEKNHPDFVAAIEAVRDLQLVRGVDFTAAVTAILKTLPQRCKCGHNFALKVLTSNVTAAA